MAKRDNEYLEKRLMRDFPDTYRELSIGRFKSVREAALACGLIKERTAVQVCKNAFTKATPAERDEIVSWLMAEHGELMPAASSSAASVPIAAAPTAAVPSAPLPVFETDNRLTAWAKARILHIMSVRGMSPGDVVKALGSDVLDPSVSNAVNKDFRIMKSSNRVALPKWIKDNEWVP